MINNTGMYSSAVRWWLFFVVIAIAFSTAIFAGLGKFILENDKTYLSFGILAIFFSASLHVGYKVVKRGSGADFGVAEKSIGLCTAFGLLGTMVGLMFAVGGAFAEIDVSSHESLKIALTSISIGVSSALLTTLVGVVAAICLQLQLMLIREKWRA